MNKLRATFITFLMQVNSYHANLCNAIAKKIELKSCYSNYKAQRAASQKNPYTIQANSYVTISPGNQASRYHKKAGPAELWGVGGMTPTLIPGPLIQYLGTQRYKREQKHKSGIVVLPHIFVSSGLPDQQL